MSLTKGLAQLCLLAAAYIILLCLRIHRLWFRRKKNRKQIHITFGETKFDKTIWENNHTSNKKAEYYQIVRYKEKKRKKERKQQNEGIIISNIKTFNMQMLHTIANHSAYETHTHSKQYAYTHIYTDTHIHNAALCYFKNFEFPATIYRYSIEIWYKYKAKYYAPSTNILYSILNLCRK